MFPQAIGLAATWDTDLMHRVADTISTEARAKYNEAQRKGNYGRYYGLTFWSPNINIFRDPRWGEAKRPMGKIRFSLHAWPLLSSRAWRAPILTI